MASNRLSILCRLAVFCCLLGFATQGHAAPLVPGTGTRIAQVGDDFEDPNWQFTHNFPKSSKEQDERVRTPSGMSANRRWYEGVKRGQPDLIKVVPTPSGGLFDSGQSLLLRTRNSGVPNRYSYGMEQDDFVANCYQTLGGKIPVHQSPNVVVRVFMPPMEQWENRTGPTFGFRLALDTHTWKVPDKEDRPRGWLQSSSQKRFMRETYWPGMFVDFRSETDRGNQADSAQFRIRGVRNGRDIPGPKIDVTGWWTLGMSVTPDGMVHYYISKGLEDLTKDDYVTSQYPYGYRAERFRTFFFNVCNRHDGRTWSTPWVVDDSHVYYVPTTNVAARRNPRGK